jgi:hypothetical protein
VAFHQLLASARKTWLVDALRDALREVPADTLREQLGEAVPRDAGGLLATADVRDEYVFPVPVLLEAAPSLLGYYRLLLGTSQKAFYRGDTGFGFFRAMERSGTLKAAQREKLPELCAALAEPLAELVRQLAPPVSIRDLNDLTLLTLGSQFQGASNVLIGQQATLGVFLSIAEIVEKHVVQRDERRLVVENAAGRKVLIRLAADPDVRIQEDFEGTLRNKVAVEIKGGTDVSNVHNRAGEAEKSHQKAKGENFRDFWTIILKRGVDMSRLRSESPTTNSWFDISEVLARQGPDWEEFRSRVAGDVGIPI